MRPLWAAVAAYWTLMEKFPCVSAILPQSLPRSLSPRRAARLAFAERPGDLYRRPSWSSRPILLAVGSNQPRPRKSFRRSHLCHRARRLSAVLPRRKLGARRSTYGGPTSGASPDVYSWLEPAQKFWPASRIRRSVIPPRKSRRRRTRIISRGIWICLPGVRVAWPSAPGPLSPPAS